MCAAAYPVKRIDWDRMRRSIEAANPDPAAAALRYVFEVDNPNAVIEKAGFVKVRYAGTGFLMIRRGALEPCARAIRSFDTSAITRPTMGWQVTSGLRCSSR
jgi:hypothetical protein